MRTFYALLMASMLAPTAWTKGRETARHWQLASKDPDRIFLTFHGDPATRRAVTWRTDSSVTNAVAEIAYALGEPGFGRDSLREPATTETIELTELHGQLREAVNYHSVIFTDLEPDTLYAYRVGNGNKHWSEWIQFRTAAASPQPFKFVYFGDAQNEVLSRWSRVIRMANQIAPDASFALHAGDLINHAHRDVEWAEWFKAGGFLHAQWTGIPVIGNHEYEPWGGPPNERMMSALWRPQFTLSTDETLPETIHETVYTVDYQGVRIIVLNSCNEIDAQSLYLDRALRRPGALWKIVTFHHPIFSPGARKNLSPAERQLWKELLAEHQVDFVLQGHDHTYVRGQVPVLTNGVPAAEFETLYVTSVSGPKQYAVNKEHMATYTPEHYSTVRQGMNTQFFQVLEFGGNRATYKAYTATGELYDQATIEKNFETGAKNIIQEVPATEERNYQNTTPYTQKGR